MAKLNRLPVLTGALVALGTVLFAAGAGRAQTLEPVDGLVVVDANNKKVGNALGDDLGTGYRTPLVAFTVNGRLVLATTDAAGFSLTEGAFFESTDCTGTPYGSYEGRFPYLAAAAVVMSPGRTVYIPDPNATPRTITIKSYFFPKQSDVGPCRSFGSQSWDGQVPLVPLIDLSTHFTPPFRLVPSSGTASAQCCGDCDGGGTVTIDEILTSVNSALNGCPLRQSALVSCAPLADSPRVARSDPR